MPPQSLLFAPSSRSDGRSEDVGGILPTAKDFVQRVGSGQSCPDGADGIWYICPRDGTRVKLPRKCDNERLCPKCSRAWAWHEARNVQAKLDGMRVLWSFGYVRHVIVSYPSTPAQTPEELQGFYDDFKGLLEGAGFEGGWVVYHPERHEGAKCWRDGPHGHALAWGWNSISLDGAVLKVVGARPDLQPTVSYLLNHAGFAPRCHVGRYFGVALRDRDVPPVRRPDPEAPVCPLCGSDMIREEVVDFTQGGRWEKVGWGPPGRWEI